MLSIIFQDGMFQDRKWEILVPFNYLQCNFLKHSAASLERTQELVSNHFLKGISLYINLGLLHENFHHPYEG